jgi:hypothetical protein
MHAGGFGSGSLDPANLTRALEAEAAKDDNRRKLADAPAGATRHLFAWLHDSDWYVSSLLRDPISTPPAPLLPDEVDVIWAAVEGRDELMCAALLRADRSGLVEVDLTSGADLPRRHTPGAASGAPDDPPSCVVCQGPGAWTVWTVERLNPATGVQADVLAWMATCESDATHRAMPGRALSALELTSLDRSDGNREIREPGPRGRPHRSLHASGWATGARDR